MEEKRLTGLLDCGNYHPECESFAGECGRVSLLFFKGLYRSKFTV